MTVLFVCLIIYYSVQVYTCTDCVLQGVAYDSGSARGLIEVLALAKQEINPRLMEMVSYKSRYSKSMCELQSNTQLDLLQNLLTGQAYSDLVPDH